MMQPIPDDPQPGRRPPERSARAGGAAARRPGRRRGAGAISPKSTTRASVLWYIGAAASFFLFGGVLALLMRIQLAVPGNDFLSAEQYNQIFTLHGSVMMFLFAVPIFEAVSILLLPQMLGARDLPFPRLSAYGFWGFVLGGIFLCGSIFFNAAPRGGWFMYPPLTTAYQPGIGADIWLLGFSFIEVAAIAAAVELIVGVLKCRAPGHADQSDSALLLVRARGRRDGALCVPAAHRGNHSARARTRLSAGRFSMPRAAAIRCSGSICSGSSVIPRCTSSSCPRSRSSR